MAKFIKSGEDPDMREYRLEKTPSLSRMAARLSNTFLTSASRRTISKNMYKTMILAKLMNLNINDVMKSQTITVSAFRAVSYPPSKIEKSIE